VDLWRLTFCYVKGNLKNIFSRNIWRQKKSGSKLSDSKVLYISRYWPRSNYYQRQNHYENYENKDRKKNKKTYPTIHTAVYAKKDQKMKKKVFPVICRSVPVDIEPPFGLVRMFFDMSLTNSRKGCMTMVKVKYDKKVDCMQNYAKQSVKKSIKESSNVQRRVF